MVYIHTYMYTYMYIQDVIKNEFLMIDSLTNVTNRFYISGNIIKGISNFQLIAIKNKDFSQNKFQSSK